MTIDGTSRYEIYLSEYAATEITGKTSVPLWGNGAPLKNNAGVEARGVCTWKRVSEI